MFYVNDINGLRFKGPLEQLEQWRAVNRKVEIKPLDNNDDSLASPNGPGSKAITAYQQIVSKGNMVEPLVHVHQIMSSPPATISPDTPLIEAWARLRNNSTRQLIVITEKREVVGMLSDKDILKRLNIVDNMVQVEQQLLTQEVSNKEFVSTASISDIRRVAKVMAQFGIDAMPVMADEKLVGIVTRGDILRSFAANPRLNLWG